MIRAVRRLRDPLGWEWAQQTGLLAAQKARLFHTGLPGYEPTPLRALPALARHLGLSKIWVKDEAGRFGLKAFKALGGSYAIARTLSDRLGAAQCLSLEQLRSGDARLQLGDICLVTATDGNHGAGIAWTAGQLQYPARVYMPRGTARERVRMIESLGAQAVVTPYNYDGTARLAFQAARENSWLLAQDTTFEGYELFPAYCMTGYGTLSLETLEALEQEVERPTHVLIQAGAGTLAASVAGFFAQIWPEAPPRLMVVEADSCNAIQRTAEMNDGMLHSAPGSLETIMAGLSVGEVCTVAWQVLTSCADDFLCLSDDAAADGMRVLGAPMGNDPRIISGESGAAGLGLLWRLMRDEALMGLADQLGLNDNARVLCFNTEGDTDPENYRRVVWEGAYGKARA